MPLAKCIVESIKWYRYGYREKILNATKNLYRSVSKVENGKVENVWITNHFILSHTFSVLFFSPSTYFCHVLQDC